MAPHVRGHFLLPPCLASDHNCDNSSAGPTADPIVCSLASRIPLDKQERLHNPKCKAGKRNARRERQRGTFASNLGGILAERSGCRALPLLIQFLSGLPWEIDRKDDTRHLNRDGLTQVDEERLR